MSADEKIRLIDEMIKEDPDYTIRDYLDLLEEIERIGKTTDNFLKLRNATIYPYFG